LRADFSNSELIDAILEEKQKQMALDILKTGEKLGYLQTASEIIAHRFSLQPAAVIQWYQEKKLGR
jgi:hypothetical protein